MLYVSIEGGGGAPNPRLPPGPPDPAEKARRIQPAQVNTTMAIYPNKPRSTKNGTTYFFGKSWGGCVLAMRMVFCLGLTKYF